MSVWVREQLQSAKLTYNEPGRDVTWTALVISSDLCIVSEIWHGLHAYALCVPCIILLSAKHTVNALVISSDLCSVWQFHIFYITMTGSFLLSSCSVFLLIIKLTSTWSCLYSRPWATPEQPLVEDTHTCTALSFVTLRTSWVYKSQAWRTVIL